MLVFGTQMHCITFIFVCIELVILFYLFVHRLARPDDKATYLNIILIILLIIYNITGGLFPDPALPGSYFFQECIAYGTGFITPSFFPYFVYKGFGLSKMKFHVKKGVWLFLILPYVLFVCIFSLAQSVEIAKNILVIPVLYAIWVIISLFKAVQYKYKRDFRSKESREEIFVLFLSLTPWIALPIIDYFELGQSVEATTTNTGFLLMLALHLKRNVLQLRDEHKRLLMSEQQLQTFDEQLQQEVERRTEQLERVSKEQRFLNNCDYFQLTAREKEIAVFICQGNTYRDIGEQLHIADRTVAKHAQNIFEKVRVSNKMELCAKLEKVLNIT